jgi:hypothetical protein
MHAIRPIARLVARTILATLVVAGLSPSGCGSDEGAAPPGVQWLADGAGEANVEPLEIIRPGRRAPAGRTWGHRTRFRGRTVVSTTRNELYREAPEGVFLDGTVGDGWFEHPQLVVPITVRVGMKWSSKGRDADGAVVFEVTGREVKRTLFGMLPVWTITETGAGGAVLHEYFEGRGENVIGTAARYVLTVPLDQPMPAEEVDTQEIQPTPLLGADGKQLSWPGVDVGPATLLDPGKGASRTLALEATSTAGTLDGPLVGRSILCFRWDGATLAAVTHTDAGGTYYKGSGCPWTYSDTDSGSWFPGDGATVLEDGIYWPRRQSMWAMFVNPKKGATYLDPNGMSGMDLVQVLDWSLFEFADGKERRQLSGFRPAATWSTNGYDAGRDFVPSALLAGAGADGASPSWDPSLGIVDDQRRLWPTRVHDAVIDPPLPSGGHVGGLSFGVRVEGRVAYLASFGHVDRLALGADGFHLSRLANVALPTGHALTAAVEDAGRLLLFSQVGGTDSTHSSRMGTTYAWTAPAAAESARVDEPVDASLGVNVRWLGADAQVCWPATKAPFDPSGWKIFGRPAARVILDGAGPCALVVRDLDAMASDAWQGSFADAPLDWNSLEANVPGMGRMAFAGGDPSMQPFHYNEDFTRHVPVSGGGAVSATWVYAPGGAASGSPPYGHAESSFGTWPDPAGLGLWTWGTKIKSSAADTETFAVLYRGTTSTRVILPTTITGQTAAPTVLGGGEAGGLLLTLGNDTWFASPDGKVETLAATARTSSIRVRRKNGQYCGRKANTAFCLDAAGSVVVEKPVDWVEHPAGWNSAAGGWNSLGDGTFLMLRPASGAQPASLVRVDADTLDATPYPDASSPATYASSLRIDTRGRLWGVLTTAKGDSIGGRLGPSGCEPIESMSWARTLGAGAGGIVPTAIFPYDEMTVVLGTDESGKGVSARYFPAN